MIRRYATCIFAVILILGYPHQTRAETLRYALIIGNNHGPHGKKPLRYAERDAKAVYQVLTELGGFSKKHTRLLLGSSAEAILSALSTVEADLKQSRRSGKRHLLWIYYSGHANARALQLGQTELPFITLSHYLKKSRADVRVAIIDSCRSGQLVAMKGGRPGLPYAIHLDDQMSSSGYAVITSSAADELSQESVEIRGSFFTHYLVSALRGAGDRTHDGKVTLDEAYRYAYARTVAHTSATLGGGQHPMYRFLLSGRGDIVLTTISDRAELVVFGRKPARVAVLDAKGEWMIAEANLSPERPVRLAVAPGTYRVYLISNQQTRETRTTIRPHASRHLSERNFRSTNLHHSVAKGGLFQPQLRQRIGGGFLLRRMPLSKSRVAFGSSVYYRLELPVQLQPVVRLNVATAADQGVSTGYLDIGAIFGLGYVLPLHLVTLRSELMLGYEHMLQDDRNGVSRHSGSLSYIGSLGAEIPIGPLIASIDTAIGARLFSLRDSESQQKSKVHRFDWQLHLGVGWSWESSL